MSPTQPTRATVTSSISRKLRRRFDFRQSVAAPSLLTWFEVIGYTVLLEQDIASLREIQKIKCSTLLPRIPYCADRSTTFGFAVPKAQVEHFITGKCLKYRIGRTSYSEVILRDRLHSALHRINPTIPDEAIAAAISEITTTDSNLLENNRRFHKFLTDGIEVEYLLNEQIVHDKVWLIDSHNLLNNDWLVIHPFTVVEGSHAHCPDVVVFINGLPLAVIVSIHPSNEQSTLQAAYERLQTCIKQIPKLFCYNTFLVITYGNRARIGTLTSDLQEFLPWCTIDGEAVAVDGFPGISKLPNPEGEDFPDSGATELEMLIQGVFDKRRIRELIQHFIVFEDTEIGINKKIPCQPFCTIRHLPVIKCSTFVVDLSAQ